MKSELLAIFSVVLLLSLFSLVAADTTAPVLGIYLGQDDNADHNQLSYKPTIYANLWNKEYQTSVVQCQIDWNDGSGWESVSKGTEGSWYSVGHTYSSTGLKTVNYRCKNSAGLWTTGNVHETNYDTITIQALAPTTAIYLGEEPGTHNTESHNYTIYAGLWNNDAVYDMDECKINWGDGAGFESVDKGTEDNRYFVSYTYSTEGLKTVSYKCKNSAGVWSTNNMKHQSFDEITLDDCDDCSCGDSYSETFCEANSFFNITFDWTCEDGCSWFNVTNLIEDCSYSDTSTQTYCSGVLFYEDTTSSTGVCDDDTGCGVETDTDTNLLEDCTYSDVDYGSYYCVGENKTRDITTQSGVCDDDTGCGIDSSVTQETQVCQYGCSDGQCQNETVCNDGDTRDYLSSYYCNGLDWNLNESEEVCFDNAWNRVFNFSFFQDCRNDTVQYSNYYCMDANKTRDVTIYEGKCSDRFGCSVESSSYKEMEVCQFGCFDGNCLNQTCTDGETRNLWGVDFCSGLNVLSNVTYEQCFGNNWYTVEIFDQFKEDCSGVDILENQTCQGDDLLETWSTPACDAGQCGRTMSTNLTQCEYGCANDECLPPTDYPTCSVDFLESRTNGLDHLLGTNTSFNTSDFFAVHGYASANSENFSVNRIYFNRTSPDFTILSWEPAGSSVISDFDWKTGIESDQVYFSEGNHELCCKVESRRCAGGPDNCEFRYYEECSSFCIDSDAPNLTIHEVDGSNEWNMSFFIWSWEGSDSGCAGFDGSYNLTVVDSNNDTVWNETDFTGSRVTTYGLENNTRYNFTIFTEDKAGNVVNASYSIFVLFGSNTTSCVENWQCTSWSSCRNDKRTRSCTDLNNCGTEYFKPVEEKDCGSSGGSSSSSGSVNIWRGSSNETISSPAYYQTLSLSGKEEGGLSWIWWLLIILLIIAIFLIIIWIVRAA